MNNKVTRKANKETKGITLIALVITIIIMLILAGVAISMAIDSEGLFGKANTAAENWNTAVAEENSEINSLYEKMEEVMYGYNKPYGLEGFTHIKGTWDTGYVIQDSIGNQYVWVPVPDYGIFVADEDFRIDTTTYYGNANSWSVKDENGNWTFYDEEDEEYKNMLRSVKKYGGFYVGAYEACYGEDGQAWSKPYTSKRSSTSTALAEGMLWNCITSYEEAQTACNLFSVKDSTCSLMYGKQWDAVCRFVSSYGDKKSLEKYKVTFTGSGPDAGTAWGEITYSNGVNNSVQEEYKANNIYNLLGNVFEVTLEKGGNYRVDRGGAFTAGAGGCSVVSRGPHYGHRPENGFRSAIWRNVPAK